jgi:hypothetical protein
MAKSRNIRSEFLGRELPPERKGQGVRHISEVINEMLGDTCAVGHGCYGPLDNHHITTRGAGGSDDPENIVRLCRKHHSECHSIGRESFFKKYDLMPLLERALLLKQK